MDVIVLAGIPGMTSTGGPLDLEAWIRLGGRLHPLAVHFPIALVLAAVAIEMLSLPGRRSPGERLRGPSGAAAVCLLLGVLGALAAAGSGWILADREPLGGAAADTVTLHRWLGVAAGTTALLALAACGIARRRPTWGRAYRGMLLAAAGLVGATGHFGGTLVHGAGHLTEVFARAGVPADDGSAVAAAEVAGQSHPAVAVLTASCIECHGPDRVRGGLRLDSAAGIAAGGDSGPVLLAGDPGGSELIRRVRLPIDDPEFMPRGGDRLADKQIAMLEAWVAAGAPWAEPEREGAVVDPGPSPAPEESNAMAAADREARDVALGRLRAAGIAADRVSRVSEDVVVRASMAGPAAGDIDLSLLRGLEPFLVELDLARTAVTDAGLAGLPAFTRLRRLDLGATEVTSDGVSSLASLESLEVLTLFGTSIDDAALVTVGRLPALRRVHLWDTAVSDGAIAVLVGWRPELEVVRGSE